MNPKLFPTILILNGCVPELKKRVQELEAEVKEKDGIISQLRGSGNGYGW